MGFGGPLKRVFSTYGKWLDWRYGTLDFSLSYSTGLILFASKALDLCYQGH